MRILKGFVVAAFLLFVAGVAQAATCSHSEFEVGEALSKTCSECAQLVCNYDSFCCENQWDAMCVIYAKSFCTQNNEGDNENEGGNEGGQQCHSPCEVGPAMNADCSDCVLQVCLQNQSCCRDAWTQDCVDLANQLCDECKEEGNQNGGACHDPFETGAKLSPTCEYDDCVKSCVVEKVCKDDPYCCHTAWDDLCVYEANQAEFACQACKPAECNLAHPVTETGEALNECDPCVASVCAQDFYCCSVYWDEICVAEAAEYCENVNGTNVSMLPHSVCEVGKALPKDLNKCTEAVCKKDPHCCEKDWDAACVLEAILLSQNEGPCNCTVEDAYDSHLFYYIDSDDKILDKARFNETACVSGNNTNGTTKYIFFTPPGGTVVAFGWGDSDTNGTLEFYGVKPSCTKNVCLEKPCTGNVDPTLCSEECFNDNVSGWYENFNASDNFLLVRYEATYYWESYNYLLNELTVDANGTHNFYICYVKDSGNKVDFTVNIDSGNKTCSNVTIDIRRIAKLCENDVEYNKQISIKNLTCPVNEKLELREGVYAIHVKAEYDNKVCEGNYIAVVTGNNKKPLNIDLTKLDENGKCKEKPGGEGGEEGGEEGGGEPGIIYGD